MVAPIVVPNEREMMKYSPPPSTRRLVAISEMANAVGNGDRVADEDDQEGAEEADVGDGVAKTEKEDRAEDGADGGEEDRGGAETVSG